MQVVSRGQDDTGNIKHRWNYTFTVTANHPTPEQLEPLRQSSDTLADEALERLNLLSQQSTQKAATSATQQGRREDYYEILRQHHEKDLILHSLWLEAHTVPDWVDWDQIARGQDVFYRYGGPALISLTYQSLLGGMGSRRLVETLVRTGGFSVKVARRRLLETTQHLLQITKSLESIKPGGAGHVSSLRVRLLHASVRKHILDLESSRPGYYDVKEFGVPINDLDSMGTILSFSAALIWLGFPRQGIYLREQEIVDFTALWRLVAYYLGTPTEYLETPQRAKNLLESMLLTEINPSEKSGVLAQNIILSLQDQAPVYASHEFLTASARCLIGNDLGDALGLSQSNLYYKALFTGQCIFFMAICYGYRSIPSLDRSRIARLKRLLYATLIENKSFGLGQESTFEMQYLPSLDTTTTLGTNHKRVVKAASVERRNLATLVAALTFGGFAAWYIIRVTVGLIGQQWRR